MSDIAIKVEGISKQYRLGVLGTGTISHDLNKWWHSVRGKEDPYAIVGQVNDRTVKNNSEYVWALKDINFEVKKGEILGIIGRNGAGKSTLLKILSKVTGPSSGKIAINGRIAALLEVGTGFHPELTGRENVYLNGAILGMTKKEISKKFDEIVDFSGCEKYIDTPVKRYSSGMIVRLGFAVAAHLEPEILIVDEVLAVGDAEFQKKCLGKMKDVSVNEGRTVLFVSHNMAAVRSLCTRGIVLEQGKVVMEGNIDKVLNFYLKSNHNRNNWKGEDGDNSMKLLEVEIFNENKKEIFKNTDPIQIFMKFELGEKFNDIVVGVNICTAIGNPLIGLLYNDYNDYNEIDLGIYEVTFTIPACSLATGDYEIEFNLSIPNVKRFTSEKSNLSFSIVADTNFGNRFYVQNNGFLNSIVRPNWFNSIKKIK